MIDRTVRDANASDVGALVVLRGEMFEAMRVAGYADGTWRRLAADWFTNRVDDRDYCIAVVESGGHVCATAMGAVRDAAPSPSNPNGRDVLVSNVCTAPAARRRGHARAAVEHVMAWAVGTGVGRAELMATTSGQALYRELGFRPTPSPTMRADLLRTGVHVPVAIPTELH